MAPNGPELNPWQVAIVYLALATLAGVLGSWAWVLVRLYRRRPLLDEPPAPVVPWGGRSVAAVVVLYVAVQVGVAWLYMRANRAGLVGPARVDRLGELPALDQLGLVMAINLAVVALVPALLRATSGATPADLGFGRGSPLGRDLRRGFVACLILLPPVYGVFLAATKVWEPRTHPAQEALARQASGVPAVLVFVAAVVAAPAAEELLFRGVLLGWLTRAATLAGRRGRLRPIAGPAEGEAEPEPEPEAPGRGEVWLVREELRGGNSAWEPPRTPLGPPPGSEPRSSRPTMAGGLAAWLPNAIVSALFAGMHYEQWPAPVPLFVLSLALGWLYQRTGRLGGPLALHATFNGFSTVVMFLALNSGEVPPEAPPAPGPAGAEADADAGAGGSAPAPSPTGVAELTAHGGDLGSPWRTSGRVGAGAGPGGTPPRGPRRGRPWTRKARPSSAISSNRAGPPSIPTPAPPSRPAAT
jgi:membrane protease YdiL (CAAX protease family)